jgi:hypothetical protein
MLDFKIKIILKQVEIKNSVKNFRFVNIAFEFILFSNEMFI